MSAGRLFEKAAYLLQGPENYSCNAHGAVINPETSSFCLTGLLERANCRDTNAGKVRGHDSTLIEAKAILCRRLNAIHLDVWERDTKPDWQSLRCLLLEAATC